MQVGVLDCGRLGTTGKAAEMQAKILDSVSRGLSSLCDCRNKRCPGYGEGGGDS